MEGGKVLKIEVHKTASRYEVHLIEEFPLEIPAGDSEATYVQKCISETELLHTRPVEGPGKLDIENLDHTVAVGKET